MVIKKYKIQNIEVVKKNQPDLALFLKTHFSDVSTEIQGRIAGSIIEFVLQSGGSASVFDETIPTFDEEELDNFF